jgi:hypothetical protein
MHKHFYFKLVKEDRSKRMLQSRAMHVMAAFFMLFYGLQYISILPINWTQIIALLPASIAVIAVVIFKRKILEDANTNRVFRILELGFLTMGCLHFLQHDNIISTVLYVVVTLFIGLILWMENRIFHDQFIDFVEKEVMVELPLYNKKIAWKNITQVTLKNHYLSLELPNNKLLQYRVKDTMTAEERIEFTRFCEERCGR